MAPFIAADPRPLSKWAQDHVQIPKVDAVITNTKGFCPLSVMISCGGLFSVPKSAVQKVPREVLERMQDQLKIGDNVEAGYD